MMGVKQQSRFLASLLALAVFVSQSSFVLASFDMDPVDGSSSSTIRCTLEEMAPDVTSVKVEDCCKLNDCASNYCVPGGHFSSSAIFNTVALLHGAVYSHTVTASTDRSPAGLEPSSLYRPPRLDT